jgi:hypothetical protein
VDPDASPLVQSASPPPAAVARRVRWPARASAPSARAKTQPSTHVLLLLLLLLAPCPLARAGLRERTAENKATYDKQRLDDFYRRDYRINRILGAEVVPEPCDPRDPEVRSIHWFPYDRVGVVNADP